jgi:hypothetical protein
MSQSQNESRKCSKFSQGANMTSVGTKLRDLRSAATPRLSVRAMAAALDMPLGTYSNYESSRFKRAALPLDLTRKIASVLVGHGVDAAEVMKLAGLNEGEAEPEAAAIEAARPQVQFVSLQLALPSEAALRDMFRSMLVLIPEGASKDEAAEILARRLPSGLAAIGPVLLDPLTVATPAAAATPQYHARDHREAEPPSRI